MSTPRDNLLAQTLPQRFIRFAGISAACGGGGGRDRYTYKALPIEKITQTKKAVVRGDDGQLRLDKKARPSSSDDISESFGILS